MGMPVELQIVGHKILKQDIEDIFSYLRGIDEQFSTYKSESEVERFNRGEISNEHLSSRFKEILELSEQTKKQTFGYFDVFQNGMFDPSGIVKGYAIHKAASILVRRGYHNFSLEIAGDVQVFGQNFEREPWRVGIKNPFNTSEVIKIVSVSDKGVATSGNYVRGEHIINPINQEKANAIASVTVIADTIYDADRMATAAFAMGINGIYFLEQLQGYEGYMVTLDQQAIMTSRFEQYTHGTHSEYRKSVISEY